MNTKFLIIIKRIVDGQGGGFLNDTLQVQQVIAMIAPFCPAATQAALVVGR